MAQTIPTKASPLGKDEPRAPPAIIPVSGYSPGLQHLLMGMPQARVGTSIMIPQPSLATQSWPGSFIRPNQELSVFPQQAMQQRIPMPTFFSAPAQLPSRMNSSSPEEDDDEVLNDDDPRSKRRREMNRLAQQKSRLKKDQKITDLSAENDKLKERIIALETELKVWKNMTKKNENEANNLQKKLEDITEKYDECKKQLKAEKSKVNEMKRLERPHSLLNNIPAYNGEELRDGVKIEENANEKINNCFQTKQEITEPGIGMLVETSGNLDTKLDMMSKEIQSLTTELQRMYALTNQQAEQNKTLHQALEDQQARFLLHEIKVEDDSQLELSPVQQAAGTYTSKKTPCMKRWMKRNATRGISKKDFEKYKTIARLMKNKSIK